MSVDIPESEVRRSFTLSVFNGVAFNFATRLIDPPLVLTWFVSHLTSSNILIGLVTPLGQAGWLFPQVFISSRVQRMGQKMPAYRFAASIRVTAWMVLGTAVWFFRDPTLLLVVFFLLYTTAWVAAGLGGLSFFDIVAKTIPAWQRGRLFGWRQFLGGLLGLGGGWIVREVLSRPALAFPRGHALLFLLYGFIMVPAASAFSAIREPAEKALPQLISLDEQLERARQILRSNCVYRQYIGARFAIALSGTALPFYGIYAKQALDAPEAMVGVYVAVRVGAQLTSNLLWGRLSDRRGNRLVMQLFCVGLAWTALLALLLVGLTELLEPQGDCLPYLAFPLFFFDGAILPAKMLLGPNFLLELAPEAERPLYLGLSNTLIGIVVLISGLGGVLVSLLGFVGLFGAAVGLGLLGLFLTSQLPEPRQEGLPETAREPEPELEHEPGRQISPARLESD